MERVQIKKQWTMEEIKSLITRNDEAVKKGVLALYARQTEFEQMESTTRCLNGIGFNAYDANFLGGMAKRMKELKPITQKQVDAMRRALIKYSGQLTRIANHEI